MYDVLLDRQTDLLVTLSGSMLGKRMFNVVNVNGTPGVPPLRRALAQSVRLLIVRTRDATFQPINNRLNLSIVESRLFASNVINLIRSSAA